MQVRTPRRQCLSGMRKGLPDHFDFDSEIEVLPGAVRGEGGGLALDGESEAGAVAQGEAPGACLGSQFCDNAGHRTVERADLAAESRDSLPGEVGVCSTVKQAGMHLSKIDCAQQAAVEQRQDGVAARLIENHGQNCRSIENRGLSQATPPLPGGLPRGVPQ